jgi:hypothetical protein
MRNIRKEAAQVLLDWYNRVAYDEDNIECINHDGFKRELGHQVLDDKELVLEISKQGKSFFRHNNVKLLDFLSIELKNDKEVVLDMVKTNGNNLEFAKESFKDDKEIVLVAVKSTAKSFQYASDRLRDDKEIVNYILEYSPPLIEYASRRFRNDKELVIDLLKIDKTIISKIDAELKGDTEVLLACWAHIKEDSIYEGSRTYNYSMNLFENMADHIKPLFEKIIIDVSNTDFIREMDVCFNHLVLNKELNTSQNKQAKKVKM